MKGKGSRSSRRSFLRQGILALCGLVAPSLLIRTGDNNIAGMQSVVMAQGAGQASVIPAVTEGQQIQAPLKAKRWGMVIDTRALTPKIINSIIETCHGYHNVPRAQVEDVAKKTSSNISVPAKEGRKGSFGLSKPLQDIKWIWQDSYEAAFPNQYSPYLPQALRSRSFPLLCNHCEYPACARACPTGATFQQSDGIVCMDYHRCIGCRYCMAACPYGARSFNFANPLSLLQKVNENYPIRNKGVVEKCTFCVERLALGKIPLCVEAAGGGINPATGKIVGGAIAFGDLEDPDSEPRKLLEFAVSLRRKPHLGAGPSVYYLF